jgi:K+-sensing histidine kinase KdpD
MAKNQRTKNAIKLGEAPGCEPRSDVWIVADEPRYDHMARVARDARTFLGALTANADWLRSGVIDQVDPAELVEAVADIETCCERLNNLLEDALLGTRQNGLTVRRAMLSMGSVLNAALKQVRRAADVKKIAIEVFADSDVAVMLDRQLFTRAAARLLERIILDTESGAEVSIRYVLENEQVIVTFARNDASLRGLPSSHHTLRPGQPKADRSDLEFCHIVAESHGGSLTVGAGVTFFRMVLPWVGPVSDEEK